MTQEWMPGVNHITGYVNQAKMRAMEEKFLASGSVKMGEREASEETPLRNVKGGEGQKHHRLGKSEDPLYIA